MVDRVIPNINSKTKSLLFIDNCIKDFIIASKLKKDIKDLYIHPEKYIDEISDFYENVWVGNIKEFVKYSRKKGRKVKSICEKRNPQKLRVS